MKHTISVYIENGDHIDTTINATVPEIVRYYFSAPIVMDYGGNETKLRARSIVFHNEPNRKPWPGRTERRERLCKIWNVMDATMKRYDLQYRTRVQVEVAPDGFTPETYRESYAYLPSDRFDCAE